MSKNIIIKIFKTVTFPVVRMRVRLGHLHEGVWKQGAVGEYLDLERMKKLHN
jgi:hypothetical protein